MNVKLMLGVVLCGLSLSQVTYCMDKNESGKEETELKGTVKKINETTRNFNRDSYKYIPNQYLSLGMVSAGFAAIFTKVWDYFRNSEYSNKFMHKMTFELVKKHSLLGRYGLPALGVLALAGAAVYTSPQYAAYKTEYRKNKNK